MKYIVLVSHGDFAYGLHSALQMLGGGKRDDIIYMGLAPDMGSEVFTEEFKKKLEVITNIDDILLFGDIGGGSPLTMAANALSEKGLLDRAYIYGGVNLPLALNAMLMKDVLEMDELDALIMQTGQDELKKMEFSFDDSDDDI